MESDLLILVARVMLMTLFVMTGWQKLRGFAGTVGYMKTSGVPSPELAAIVSTVVELFFGIAIVLGVYTRIFASIFVAFTLGTALLGHRFWTMEGGKRHENFLNFFKNVSIAGGLLLLAVVGGGRCVLIGA